MTDKAPLTPPERGKSWEVAREIVNKRAIAEGSAYAADLDAAVEEARRETWKQVLNLTQVTAAATGMPEMWALHERFRELEADK